MLADDPREARKALEVLQGLPLDTPTLDDALITLAGMAYEAEQFVTAIGLFDIALKRWPDKLLRGRAALFQAAEILTLYGRTDEATRLYQAFVDRFPADPPNWIARVRLIEMLSYTQPRKATPALNSPDAPRPPPSSRAEA